VDSHIDAKRQELDQMNELWNEKMSEMDELKAWRASLIAFRVPTPPALPPPSTCRGRPPQMPASSSTGYYDDISSLGAYKKREKVRGGKSNPNSIWHSMLAKAKREGGEEAFRDAFAKPETQHHTT
jgi:hypothetical protein